MPWQENTSMDQRERFILDDRRGLYTRAELCERYGISRKTGYKWLARYDAEGRPGLQERSHAPHHCPHRIAPEMATLLCDARRHHPSWGPAKLLAWLAPRHPEVTDTSWPAISTAGDLLAREGLVKKRRRRRVHRHPGVVPPVTIAPNDLWPADFKGQFPTRDGVWCYPLTITDQHTRYLLTCKGLPNVRGEGARPVFERTFREFGLPRAIRTDNGVPFANTGLHGLTQLNVWWMRLGIQHQRIHPGSPQENGAHERMHQNPEGRGLSSSAGHPHRPAARVQSLSHGVQRRTTARIPGGRDPRFPLPAVAAPVSGAPPPARVPGTLPRQADHQRRDFSLPTQTLIHRPRPAATPHRIRGN